MSIIVRLMGGLGNQMFQYAFGKAVSIQSNHNLELDLTFLEKKDDIHEYTIRNYELNIFNLNSEIAGKEKVRSIRKAIDHPLLNRLNLKFPAFFSYHIFREKMFSFDPGYNKLKGNCYLEGYWQSEKYFKSIEELIRNEFEFISEPGEKNKELLKLITECESVSIHIRRGDMVSLKSASDFHGTCSEDYYEKGIKIILQKLKNPIFFIFTDDPAWAASRKLFSGYKIIDWNTNANSYEDMRLMSNCKHHIIANSSFSWWGAWLNRNTDKIVIAPNNWFRDSTIDTSDLIPESWQRI